jgi:pyroglutamyl-peptidase
MKTVPILVTGFEPFAGLDRNPSAEVALRLDGRTIGGGAIVARLLPVSLAGYRGALAAALDEVRPGLAIALGLAQGEASVRIERVGINLADFEIADNDGTVAAGRPVEEGGPQARFSTFPAAEIEAALLAAGIPAHCSTTAGAYLCNACLYSLLGMVETTGSSFAAGFIHLPYLPEQVAMLMASERRTRNDTPSMSLDIMTRAVEIAIEVSLGGRDAGATI